MKKHVPDQSHIRRRISVARTNGECFRLIHRGSNVVANGPSLKLQRLCIGVSDKIDIKYLNNGIKQLTKTVWGETPKPGVDFKMAPNLFESELSL